jgi:hypothetical protein
MWEAFYFILLHSTHTYINLSKRSYSLNTFLQVFISKSESKLRQCRSRHTFSPLLHFIWNFNKFKAIGFDYIIMV